MALVFLRHGTAVDERFDLTDDSRYLSAEGRAQAKHTGQAMLSRLSGSIAIFTSPLVRAVQTAELALGGAGITIAVQELLRPEAPPHHAYGELERALRQVDHVIAVGHEPSISGLVAISLGLSHHRALGRAEAIAVQDQSMLWQITA